MSKGSNRRQGVGFEDNHEAIFGKKEVVRGRFIQHPTSGKLIPAAEYVRPDTNQSAYVMGDLQGFVSPIDRTLIDDRGKLRRHNKKHGVTNSADYSPAHFDKKQLAMKNEREGNTPQAKQERVELIKRSMQEKGMY
jgi:hypothetical protein